MRQHRLRRTGAQYGEQLLLDKFKEFPQAETAVPAYGPQNKDHEHRAGQVHAGHQLAEGEQRAETVFTDCECNGPKRTDRRQAHNHIDDAEHALHQAIQCIDKDFPARADLGQGDTQKDGKQQDLQHITLGKGIHNGIGDDIHGEVHE